MVNLHPFGKVLCGLLNERILERNLRSLAQVQAVPELTWLVDALPSATRCCLKRRLRREKLREKLWDFIGFDRNLLDIYGK